jgi:hypothetical protein
MRTVRWAQIALLAVVPACAHSSSGQAEKASTSPAKTAQAQGTVPELEDATSLAASDPSKVGRSTRYITLGTTQVEATTSDRAIQAVVADGTTCNPWADNVADRCSFEESVAHSLR